jgi:hypothetical protein
VSSSPKSWRSEGEKLGFSRIQCRSPAFREALKAWRPVVTLEFDEKDVRDTIADFGRCVDDIEDGTFEPPPPEKLRQPLGASRRKGEGAAGPRARPERTFARTHWRNCDARFSCDSSRAYQEDEAGRSHGRRPLPTADEAADRELDEWIEENLADG